MHIEIFRDTSICLFSARIYMYHKINVFVFFEYQYIDLNLNLNYGNLFFEP